MVRCLLGTPLFCLAQQTNFSGLGDLPGGAVRSSVDDISRNGRVAVGLSYSSASAEYSEVFRWTKENGMIGLGDLAGGVLNSVAAACSDDGSTVTGAGTSVSGSEAFLWSSAGFQALGDFAGGRFNSYATGISGDGSVVVGSSSWAATDLDVEAFRWTSALGMNTLSGMPVGTRSEATGVSA